MSMDVNLGVRMSACVWMCAQHLDIQTGILMSVELGHMSASLLGI